MRSYDRFSGLLDYQSVVHPACVSDEPGGKRLDGRGYAAAMVMQGGPYRMVGVKRPVAVLCCAGRSYYRYLDQVSCYGEREDARTFAGGCPVVAHPPCRCWSKHFWRQAGPVDWQAEMDLGRWCVDQVIRCGGVLEHPAESMLWADRGLPRPGETADPFLYSLYIEQGWFGFPSIKKTWLLVAGVPGSDLPPLPFALRPGGPADVAWRHKELRSRTFPAFAEFLLAVARRSWWSFKDSDGRKQ